jgi:hypothetical protein
VPLLGRLPLDADLARRCDRGEIEGYETPFLEPIVEPLVEGVPGLPLGTDREREPENEGR